MLKQDYFVRALRAGAFRYRRWVVEAFSQTELKTPGDHPYALRRSKDQYEFLNPETNQWETLEGVLKNSPPFSFHDELMLKKGDLENVFEDVQTTTGTAFVNQTVLCYPFGNRIPYQNGRLNAPALEHLVEDRITSDNEYKPDGVRVSVSEYLTFCDAMTSLSGYATLCVPTVTAHSLVTDPAIKKRKKELLQENKDRLDDPAVVAAIESELIKMDRAWLKGDASEGFYIDKKSIDVNRKKNLIMQGHVAGLDTKGQLIEDALDDGWKPKDLPALITDARDGSFSRGALTALGGEAVKFNYRIFQNTSITEPDCGVTYGLPIPFTEQNASWFIGRYAFVNGKETPITESNFKSLVGQTLEVRSPIYCQTSGVNFCAKCMGDNFAKTPEAITAYAASVGSAFMSAHLKAMHGRVLSTEKLTPNFIT